ncbi:MAG: threonine synthase [Bacteroidales bacterium]|nr:threonine synthase [Bacteroidales bacterium]
MEKQNNKFIFQCVNCGKKYQENETKYLCPECEKTQLSNLPPKGVLKLIYDYEAIIIKNKINIWEKLIETDFIDLLPIKNLKSMPNLKIGKTPIYKIESFNQSKLKFNLYLKDDSQNPSYSFKDRASSLVSAYAKENNIDTIIAASTGNAGSSLASICASQKQKAIILVPSSAPVSKLSQIIMYGATLVPIKGNYDNAFDLSIKATEKFGLYNRNTAFNPLTIEGKKTVSFELFEQLNFVIPDRIFVPVGDGVIISGVYKGFEDLFKLGIIDKLPIIVAVQATKSDNLIRNIENEQFTVKKSNTIADSISVDIPRNFFMAKDYLQKYNGELISVSDKEILEASSELSKNTGLFAEPAAAAAFAGFISYYNKKMLDKNTNNVVLLTGSGLKDINGIKDILNMPKIINPDINELWDLINFKD